MLAKKNGEIFDEVDFTSFKITIADPFVLPIGRRACTIFDIWRKIITIMASTQAKNAQPNATAKSESSTKKQRVPLNCTKAFDSVYYCYSPVHQSKQYYMFGQLDDCRGRLKRFRMCAMSRFRSKDESELLYEEEEKRESAGRPPPIWELRAEFLENVAKAEQEEQEQIERGEVEKDEAWWL